jgi:hypothetical protein
MVDRNGMIRERFLEEECWILGAVVLAGAAGVAFRAGLHEAAL